MNDRIVYHRDAFSEESADKMMKSIFERCLLSGKPVDILNVSNPEAEQFMCNTLEVNNNVITPCIEGIDSFGNQHNAHWCNMSEFMKAGGAVKCLTLKL